MRTSRVLGLAALLSTASLVLPATANADPATTVTGRFAGKIAYTHCTEGTPPTPGIASGTWSVTLHGPTAKATFDILVDGAPHLAYTFPGMKEAPGSGPTHFVVYGKTQAGLLTVSVDDRSMAYRIEPYSYGGLTCASVTYPGTVD